MTPETFVFLRQQARLRQQWLLNGSTPSPTPSLAGIVRWMGAVQAQEYAEVKWSLALRSAVPVQDAEVERAFNAGEFLRTHVLRPTWHLVAPEDIRWMLELTAPRIHAASAYYHRQQGLDAAIFSRSEAVLEQALRGGQSRTRAELNAALIQAGIDPAGLRSGLLMMHAELEGLICSGPRQGKQVTYALLEERAPQATRRSREEALAELASRYFTSHGPATLRDFTWWSSLTMSDAKQALDLLREQAPFHKASPADWAAPSTIGQPAGGSIPAGLAEAELDGQAVYFSTALLEGIAPTPPLGLSRPSAAVVSGDGRSSEEGAPSAAAPRLGAPHVLLLPTFDELIVGYANYDKNRRGAAAQSAADSPSAAADGPLLKAPLVINAQVAGSWQRVIEKDQVTLQVAPFQPLTPPERLALEEAAAQYGRFLSCQPRLVTLP